MKTPLIYYGGKQTMLKHILPLIPKHSIYTECYAGGASVLFAKERVRTEVINDLNSELINFYRICQTNPEELRKEISCSLHSREMHEHAYHIYNHPTYYDAVKRAWALWYLLRVSFSAIIGSGFSYDKHGKKSHSLQSAVSNFTKELTDRIKYLMIEQREATEVLKKFDTSESFHFIDPPYVKCNMCHYAGMFNEQNLIELLDLCSKLDGKFMLTMYPNEDIAKYAGRNGWKIHKIQRNVTAAKTKRRKQEEWMVCNY